MRIISTKKEMRCYSRELRRDGRRVGLVPTMGALHAGHMALVAGARAECDAVVVSIFVNPAQFGPNEDFARYPRVFDADCTMCESAGVDAIFHPSSEEMYPAGAETFVVQEHLPKLLEGASRPTHFRGVLTVVLKLFNIVEPDSAYFGQKDYQQTVVVRRMAADLDVPVDVRVLPTEREPDGLAMSSRNRYLSAEERSQAACLFHALELARNLLRHGVNSASEIKREMRSLIDKQAPVRIDYIDIVRPDTLAPVDKAERGDVVLVAAYFGTTRLIDNAVLD